MRYEEEDVRDERISLSNLRRDKSPPRTSLRFIRGGGTPSIQLCLCRSCIKSECTGTARGVYLAHLRCVFYRSRRQIRPKRRRTARIAASRRVPSRPHRKAGSQTHNVYGSGRNERMTSGRRWRIGGFAASICDRSRMGPCAAARVPGPCVNEAHQSCLDFLTKNPFHGASTPILHPAPFLPTTTTRPHRQCWASRGQCA
ncbi:hypothetical protein C8R46DRAFT_257913 [Mycena filopes]|nr:hypothetical protein C8R46DRAFT_257913 [Mycena filopes]